MDKTNRQNARRRLLKTLGTGAGLASAGTLAPHKWVRPVVDAIVLPGHAQSSVTWYDVIEAPLLVADSEYAPPTRLFRRLVERVFPTAYAGTGDAGSELLAAHVCIGRNSSDYTLDVVFEGKPNFQYDGLLQANNVFVLLDGPQVAPGCKPFMATLEARLTSVDGFTVGDFRSGGEFGPVTHFVIPMAPCNLPGLGSCQVSGP